MFTDGIHVIDDEITLFSNVTGQFPLPGSDGNLFVKRNGRMFPDDFHHEQNHIITSGNNRVMICGCAHAGIVNIVRRAKTLVGNDPTAVVGGCTFTSRQKDATKVTAIWAALPPH